MKFVYIVILLLFFSCNKYGKLENKLISVSKEKYWKVLQWNSSSYYSDTLLLKLYSNKQYELFRFNTKLQKIISLKPDSSSDIVSFQNWDIKDDTILSFKKTIFIFSSNTMDTIRFNNSKDSLTICPFQIISN